MVGKAIPIKIDNSFAQTVYDIFVIAQSNLQDYPLPLVPLDYLFGLYY